MNIPKTLIPLAVASLVASGVAAQETRFVGGVLGQSSSNYNESSRASVQMPGVNFDHIIDNSSSWGLRVGADHTRSRYYLSYDYVSDSDHRAAKIREQGLSFSYDLMLPLGDSTRLFGGATAGVDYLSQKTSGYRNDNDWGLNAGLQVGVLQLLAENLELEAGYRYARHSNAEVDFKPRAGGGNAGTARLRSDEQLYLGLNWRF